MCGSVPGIFLLQIWSTGSICSSIDHIHLVSIVGFVGVGVEFFCGAYLKGPGSSYKPWGLNCITLLVTSKPNSQIVK